MKQIALNNVRKEFPQVTKIVDAKESIAITVTNKDNAAGRQKDRAQCALAKACVRQKIADGAIIGMSVSYLIKGDIATRYHTSVSVARELTSFDRHGDFSEGRNYVLSKVSEGARLGVQHKRRYRQTGANPRVKRTVHRTEFVRKAGD